MNYYDQVQSMNEEYIKGGGGGVELISIARALIFFLESPFPILSVSICISLCPKLKFNH